MKCSVVSLIGRPSSGKSTLVNTICERKVSITSNTPQTTRYKIRGIYTDSRGQLIFLDTPGYHISDKEINTRMIDQTLSSLSDCDIILYIVDGKRSYGKEEEKITSILQKSKKMKIIAINKTEDMESDPEIVSILKEKFPSTSILKISALEDIGIDELLIELFKISKDGTLLYGEEEFTDQDLESRISEIIREKTIEGLHDELPHSIFVEIEDLEYNEEKENVWIRGTIYTEREGQKGFIVGKGGSNIKEIGTKARKELKEIFPKKKIRLDLNVKCNNDWRKNPVVLNKLFKNKN